MAGAEVVVDGAVVGVTDRHGTLCIERDEAPTSVTVRAAGYELAQRPRGDNAMPKPSAFGMNFTMQKAR